MNRGYIKIYRKIEDSGIMGNADVCQLFLYLMVKATHKPHKIIVGTQVFILQPGQFFAGRKQLATELRSSEQRIRTALKCLEKHDIINQQPTSKGTVISLVNWGKYQDEQPAPNQHINQHASQADKSFSKNPKNQPALQPTANQLSLADNIDDSIVFTDCDKKSTSTSTNNQPAPNQRLTTKQTHNTEELKDIKTPPIAPQGGQDGDVPPAFAQFWQAYPKKTGKKAALKAWKNAKDKPVLPALLAALEKQKTWAQWLRDGGQYIPNPATWLNQGRWNDEPPESHARASPGRVGFGRYEERGDRDYGQSDFGALGGRHDTN